MVKIKQGLKTKLVAFALMLSIIPFIGVSVFSYLQAKNALVNAANEKITVYSQQKAQLVENWMKNIMSNASAVASAQDISQSMNVLKTLEGNTADPQWKEREAILNRYMPIVQKNSGIDQLILCDPKGKAVYSTDSKLTGSDLSQRDYFKRAMQGKEDVSELFFSDIIKDYVMAVAIPVLSPDNTGQVLGAYISVIPQKQLQDIIQDGIEALGKTSEAYLIDHEGDLLTALRFSEKKVGQDKISTKIAEEMKTAIASGEKEYTDREVYKDYRGREVLGYVQLLDMGDQKAGLMIEYDSSEAFVEATAMRNYAILVAVVVIAVVTLLALLFAKRLVAPLQLAVRHIEILASGDFTSNLEEEASHRKDEIGVLARAIDTMQSSMRTLIKGVIESAQAVEMTSEQVDATIHEMSSSIQGQTSTSEEIASAMEEMSTSSQSVNENIQQMTGEFHNISEAMSQMDATIDVNTRTLEDMVTSIRDITDTIDEVNDSINVISRDAQQANSEADISQKLAEEGKSALDNSVREMDIIQSSMDNLASVINGLGESASQIGEIVDVIKDVADQTNLLALNASIEAARAGEHGKGFAVVAQAIGNLAAESAQATKEINSLIKGIQNEVGQAVTTTTAGIETVKSGTNLVRATSQSLDRIFAAVNKTASIIENITESMNTQAEGSANVMNAIHVVNDKVNELMAAMEEQNASSTQVMETMRSMDEFMDQIAAAMEEQSASTEEVTGAVNQSAASIEEISAGSEEIAKNSEELTRRSHGMLEQVKGFTI